MVFLVEAMKQRQQTKGQNTMRELTNEETKALDYFDNTAYRVQDALQTTFFQMYWETSLYALFDKFGAQAKAEDIRADFELNAPSEDWDISGEDDRDIEEAWGAVMLEKADRYGLI